MKMTKSLKSALARIYFMEACDQEGWAYAALDGIRIDTNTVVFAKGSHKISIKLPPQFAAEINQVSVPGLNGKPVFDYLACRIRQREKYESTAVANPTALAWVQVRTGLSSSSSDNRSTSMLLEKDAEVLEKIKIPLALFYIRDVLAPPQKVEFKWDIRTGDEWLDELDEKRDEAESDDDYL